MLLNEKVSYKIVSLNIPLIFSGLYTCEIHMYVVRGMLHNSYNQLNENFVLPIKTKYFCVIQLKLKTIIGRKDSS
jgi:hypothetical protein